MNYWINTVSHDHVLTGIAGRFTQANHGSPRNLQRMARGDLLVFYSPKTAFKGGEPLRCFTAIGRITDDEPFQVTLREDFKPFRRAVEFFECQAAPIRPLIADLSFIQNKAKWGFSFRRGMFVIEKNDFMRIAAAMEAKKFVNCA